jgi:subtilisin family serine protease
MILVILGFSLLTSYGQEFKDGVLQGTIRIKIKPEIATALQTQSSSKGMVVTGVQALDKLNKTYSVTEMKRVFPYSPKFEGKHMKHGLHLWYELTVTAKASSRDVVKEYTKLQAVEIAEPIHEEVLIDGSGQPTYIPKPVERSANEYFNDPYLPKQWHYNNTGQTGGTPGADINLYNGWGITTGTPNVIISIHDQGVDYKHEDLAANMWVNLAEKNGKKDVDDDGNGYVDDINGFNFTNNSGSIDVMYHGTHVGGTIAAVNNNGIGVCGVAGGSGNGDGVRIMTCQILGGSHAGNTPMSYIFAADNGAVISQNSWGYSSPGAYDQAVNDAIDYFIAEAGNYPGSPMKGGVVIFASGNSSTELKMYPAAYPPVISISALDAFSTRAGYSNYGTWVTMSAPGGEAEDNALPGADVNYKNGIMSTLDKNGYGYLDGTSMACPHVSGIAGLVVSKYGGPDFTNTALKNHLITGVRENIYDIPANAAMIGKLGTGETDAVLALATDNKIAPNKITDLKLEGIAQDFASLSWSIPADNDDSKPLSFEVIYSTKEINQATMAYARIITIKNTGAVGTKIDFEVPYLQAVTKYYFSVRGIDRWGNTSDYSNAITATTNSGPTASFDPLKTALSININVTQNKVGSDSIRLRNSGEGILVWDAQPRHKDAVPLSAKPTLDYPKMLDASATPQGIKSQTLSPEILNNIQHDTTIEKGYVNQWVNLMVFGETNTKITNSSATKFYVDEADGFNLTFVDTYIQHDEATGPMIMEIYEGADISSAKLLLAQEVAKSNDPAYTGVALDEELYFEQGTYFWVVFHVPAGNKFCLGGGLELEPEYSKNCYISLNGGQTWKMFEELYYDNQVVWAVFAMSRSIKLDQYVTLNPVTGKVYTNNDTTIVAKVNAANMINGTYKANLVVNTNETGKPMIRVPVNITIQGHKPKISSVLRANFGNILVGTTKDLVVNFKNTGLGRFTFKSPQVILSNPQFTYLSGVVLNFEAATSLDLTFRFTATTVGNNYCQVTLVGEKGETYNFELFGAGMDVPVVKIDPQTATYNNLAIGDSIKGQFNIKNEGKYPLDYYMPAFSDGSNMEVIPANIHKFGYSLKVDTTGTSYVWNDIAGSGKEITSMFLGNDRQNVYKQFPLAFMFPFFGKQENFIYITKFGLVSFDDHDYINSMVPMLYKAWVNPDRYISGGGFPMRFEEAGFGHIYYKQDPDKFIVQYDHAPYWDGTGYDENGNLISNAYSTFQIVLHDNGNIRIYYKDNTIPVRDQKSNLVAIEDQTKEDGLPVNGMEVKKYNVYLGNLTFKPGTAILFNNPGLGLFSNISKPYGTVMPDQTQNITYTIKTDSLSVLPYTENLVVITNDPYTNPSIHTAAFNIVSGGVSDIHVDSTDLKFGTLYKGAIKALSFRVSNQGKAIDSLRTAVFDHNYFTLTGDVPSLLKPERTIPFTVTANAQTIGIFNDTLRLTTKNGQSFKIAASLQVIQGPVISLLSSSGSKLTSITRFLNAGANTTVNFAVKNTGSADLFVSPANNDWAKISEIVPSSGAESVMYKWKKSTQYGGPVYGWVEIVGKAGTGRITDVDPWNGKDFSTGVKIPFSFPFYGKEYDTMYIGMGLVTFTPNQSGVSNTFWGGVGIPDTAKPNNYIAPLWVFGGPDNHTFYPESGIYYQLFEDRVIVEFKDINSNFTMGNPISYEVILYKNGNIKYQYVMPEGTGNTVTQQGTIGIENENGTEGVLISAYQAVVNSNMAITLYPAHKYTVAPAETKDFKMLLDAKDLVGGSYADSIAFTNNDPDALTLTLPTKLVVTGIPQIQLPNPVVFDTVLVNLAVPTVTKEFEITNSGTANFAITGVTQDLPGDVKVEVYSKFGNNWMWTKLDPAIFPYTIPAHSAMKYRVTITPAIPKFVLDTLRIATSLTPANYKIPITANIYTPAVISLGTDTLSFYAQTSAFKIAKAVKIGNETGGLNLLYNLSINFQREIPTDMAAGNASNVSQTTATLAADKLPAMAQMGMKSLSSNPIKSTAVVDAYNRILSWDSDTVAKTRLGYNGSRAFYSATGFTAPANGFLLSHVQNWVVPGDWLNSKIKVMVYAGDADINNCKMLLSESFEHNIMEPDENGSLLTYKLSKSIDINPNEKFFVVFGFEAALTYPQGCAVKSEVVINRFMFGAPEDWYDLANYKQFNTIGWMARAVEETSGDVPWVVLTSATSGVLEPTKTDSIRFDFTARTAPLNDNIAYLVASSNDIATPEKKIVLRLIKNRGPVFDDLITPLEVSENDSITFLVSAMDQEGDNFTMAADSAYKFLIPVSYTEPDPLKKTMKFKYKPDFKSEGTHTFGFTGTDQFNNISKSMVSVTVKNVNRAPVATVVDTLKFAPHGNYKIVTANDVFTDPDADMVSLEAISGDAEILNLFVSGNSFLLMPYVAGKTSVTFMVTDKYGAKATSEVKILVDAKVLGVNEMSRGEFHVYPNPTTDFVIVSIPEEIKGNLTATVMNLLGAVVKTEKYTHADASVKIDFSSLPSGIYLLKLADNTVVKTIKIIKN